MDPKTSLQEIAARHSLAAPVYSIEAAGPDHDRRFTATVTVGDVVTHGTGSSKKQAEMAAALDAWRELNARA
jgi:ribonuclease-3